MLILNTFSLFICFFVPKSGDKIKAEGTVSYTYQEHLKTGKDTTPGVTDETGKDKDKDKLPAAGAAGVGAYYTLGMMSLLSAGFISRKKSKKEA